MRIFCAAVIIDLPRFVILAVFLYRNITVENANKKKWVRGLITGTGIKSVTRAMDFMKEIDEFKNG